MLDRRFAFVDLETTGVNPVHDRITEIAIISVDNGMVTDSWQQLVDPQMSIPEAVQALTGISNEMVAGQPAFEDLYKDVRERLSGRIFVAHNARFDYGFLRNAFKRVEVAFQSQVLCTVKLSRRVFPQHRRHNLDAVMRRHGLQCENRHRALGDADVLRQFIQMLMQSLPGEELEGHIDALTRRPSLPAQLPPGLPDRIPDTPGVYLFYDAAGNCLYIGKSVHLRSRVLSHFAADHSSGKEMQLARQTAHIDWIDTAGDLGALLRESRLVKERMPVYNRRLRRHSCLVSIEWDGEADSKPELVDTAQLAGDDVAHLHGLFRTRTHARKVLLALADEHRLCHRRLGLERGKGACFRSQIGRCSGVCAGRESELVHRLRLAEGLRSLRLVVWPWQGPVAIREECQESGVIETHVVDNWCYIGSYRSEDEFLQGDLFDSRPAFDVDTYRLLVKHLMRGKGPQPVLLQPRINSVLDNRDHACNS